MTTKTLLQSISDYDTYLKIKSIVSNIATIEKKFEHFYSLDEEEQEAYREEFTDLSVEKSLLKSELNSFENKTTINKIKDYESTTFPEYDGSKKVVIFTGSGISAESGLKTFRGNDGLWNNYKVADVCTEETYLENIELVHNFYNEIRSELSSAKPNIVHNTIAQIEKDYGENCFIITQNVDDLLERAGCKRVLHVHGFLREMECLNCQTIWDIEYKQFEYGFDACPNCNKTNNIKPNIVFFGGVVPKYYEMFKAFDSLNNPDSIVLVLGTQGNIINISDILKNFNCKKILNNLEKSEYIDDTQFTSVFYEKATVAIPEITKVCLL